MNYKKLVSIVTGIAVLAATLLPAQASALSTATMTLSGAASADGNFAVTVYENTGSDTVTGANVALDFSSAVSNVSYDYSVGPFVAATPSGGHNAYGEVSGQQPVATVRFIVASPTTVTAYVGNNSYLKHAGTSGVENFVIDRGSASFTYTAPAQGGQGGGSSESVVSTPAASSTNRAASNNTVASADTTAPAATDTPAATAEVKADTTKKDTKKNDTTQHTAAKKSGTTVWPWIILIILGAAAFVYGFRNRRTAAVTDSKAVVSDAKPKVGKTAKGGKATSDAAKVAAAATPVAVAAQKPAPQKSTQKPTAQNRKKSGKKAGKKSR